jgi:UDP-N-acetylglucosamine 3-dehydrogenase
MADAPARVFGVGVIGLGEIGQFHLRGYERSPGARVAAVTDLNAELLARTAAETGATAHDSIAALLADRSVEVVSLCLPHHLHLPVALEVIAAGKHLLVEKPLAITVEECDQIVAAAADAGVTVGVQHNQLFHGPHVRAQQLIDSGAIGRPVALRLRLGIGGKLGGWRADPKVVGGGILFDAGVHRFYMARRLFGEVAEVRAIVDRGLASGEDQAVVSLRFENGALGVIDAGYHCPPGAFDDAIEVTGDRGMLYLSGCEAEFEGFRTGPALRRYADRAWHEERVPQGDWADSVAASIDAFVRALAAGEAPPVTVQEGRRIVELIHAAYASAGAYEGATA